MSYEDAYGWCWIDYKWECLKVADGFMFWDAVVEFKDSGVWEYFRGGKGEKGSSGLFRTDCYYLVDKTLVEHGYGHIGSWWERRNNEINLNPDYFCRIDDWSEAQRGDILFFRGLPSKWDPMTGTITAYYDSHIEFLKDTPTKLAEGSWQGTAFGAQNPSAGINYETWKSVGHSSGTQYLEGVYRPKKLVWEVVCDPPDPPPDHALYQYHGDPLMLDLDGGGIRTVGLDAGVHFDHDLNFRSWQLVEKIRKYE